MDTRQAADGQTLVAGDVVRTSEDASTLAEVTHRNGAVTRLDRMSEVTVDRGDARIVVTVGPGRTWHRTGPLDDPTLYEVRCPSAVLTARFARFALHCQDDGATVVTVVEGNVVVRGNVSGSVALGDGQSGVVDPAGVMAASGPADWTDRWIDTNLALDAGRAPTISTTPGVVEIAPERPKWIGRVGVGTAVAVFVGVLAFTFVTAEQTAPQRRDTPIPAGAAAAMIRATQDRNVNPEPTTTTTPAPAESPAELAPPPAPAPEPPKATAVGTSCRQSGRTIVYTGTVTNVSQAASSFAVDAYFVTRTGTRFDSAVATVADLAPGRTARWEVRVTAPGDLRNTGASCELAGVRAV